MTAEEWNTYFAGHWNFAGAKQDSGHLAMFPEELPKRLIKMFAFVGDIVLDPFLGSGTTSLVARLLDRNSVGYEINPEFIPIIKEKLESIQTKYLITEIFEFITQKATETNFENQISKLPYILLILINLIKKLMLKNFSSALRLTKKAENEKNFTQLNKSFHLN